MYRKKRIASFLPLGALLFTGLALNLSPASQPATCYSAAGDLNALLQRMQANLRANDVLAQQYVSDDLTHTVTWDKNGKKIREKSEKVESVFSAGTWYYRIVEQNGKPLSPNKQQSLQKHQDAVSERSRGFDFVFDLRDGDPRDSIYSALPVCCLADLFENRLLRHEQINGRDNLVIESSPKADPGSASLLDRTALDWKETTWIDVNDLMPTRLEVELLDDRGFLLKGSTELRELVKMQFPFGTEGHQTETVWLGQTKKDQSNLKFLWSRQSQSFEDTSYNFRRFKVDMRVLPISSR